MKPNPATTTEAPANSQKSAVKARILIVDDHPVVRDGLLRLINNEPDLVCCGEASSASEALSQAMLLVPDAIILDLRLKGIDSLDLIKSLKAQIPGVKVLMLSQYDASYYVERALRAGALGYVTKENGPREVLAALHTVLAGQVFLTQAMVGQVLEKMIRSPKTGSDASLDELTDRELQVLQLLGSGRSTRQIADELHLSFKTVETHRENIKRKLALRSSAELVHYANQFAREKPITRTDTVR